MELFAVLVVVAVVVWFLMSPFIVFGLWNRMNELESSIKQLQLLGKTRSQPTPDRLAISVPAPDVPVVSPLPIPVSPLTQITAAATEVVESPRETPRTLRETPLTELLAVRSLRAGDSGVGHRSSTSDSAPDDSKERPVPPAAAKKPVSGGEPSTLEEILAGKWLTWVGALAVIIGAGFGFKYAVENGWLDPTRRIILGLTVGLLSFGGGAYAMRRDYRFLGQGLTGAAMGILYMSCFAAHAWHGLVSL